MLEKHSFRRFPLIAVAVLMAASALARQRPTQDGDNDWSRFRGANGNGVSDTTNLPTEVGPDINVMWATPLPPGHSSPILSNDKIFVTAVDGEQLETIALDRATGDILWRRPAPGGWPAPAVRRCHPQDR